MKKSMMVIYMNYILVKKIRFPLKVMLVLGIESSCDETAAAIIKDGDVILSSVISSQIELHKPFGGVVPELAAREHLEKIDPIVDEALEKAGVTLK